MPASTGAKREASDTEAPAACPANAIGSELSPSSRSPQLIQLHEVRARCRSAPASVCSSRGEARPALTEGQGDLALCEQSTTKTVAEWVRSDERLKEEFARITLPVLILHGTRLPNRAGARLFYGGAGSTDKTLTLYDRRFHDLLNHLEKGTVMCDITAWIEARRPDGATSGADD